MKHVHGPMTGRFSVVTERTNNLELNCPFIANEEVWRSLRANGTFVFRKFIEAIRYHPHEPNLSKWPNTGLKRPTSRFTLCSRFINVNDCISGIADYLFELHM